MLNLYKAIRAHSGIRWQEMVDAANHGADGGFSGFIYYGECVEFYRKNMVLIDIYLSALASDCGYDNVCAMLANSGRSDMCDNGDTLDNLKAWYVLEGVGNWVQDLRDNA